MKSLTLGLVAEVNHLDVNDVDDVGYIAKVLVVATRIRGSQLLGTLNAIVTRGPLYDGDVPSKSDRDDLLSHGVIEKVIVKGEHGYQAANYFGWSVWKSLKAIEIETAVN